MNLFEFIHENCKDKEIPEGQMITQVLILYRAVKTTEFDEDGDMPERVGYVASAGCGSTMQRGMVCMVEEGWAFDAASEEFGGDDSDPA